MNYTSYATDIANRLALYCKQHGWKLKNGSRGNGCRCYTKPGFPCEATILDRISQKNTRDLDDLVRRIAAGEHLPVYDVRKAVGIYGTLEDTRHNKILAGNMRCLLIELFPQKYETRDGALLPEMMHQLVQDAETIIIFMEDERQTRTYRTTGE